MVLALEKLGFIKPTEIQTRAVPHLLNKESAFISASTGTGKTLAYLIPILSKLDPDSKQLQALILAPSHELAVQIHQQFQALQQALESSTKSMLILGESSVSRQKEKLKKKPHVIIGTSGRVLELIEMKKLKVHATQHFVIDEADKQLAGDALLKIQAIIKPMPKDNQLLCASATHTKEVLDEAILLRPEIRLLESENNRIHPNIAHLYFTVAGNDKADLLRKVLHALSPKKSIVFFHRSQNAERLRKRLNEKELPAVSLFRDLDKLSRKRNLQAFREGTHPILLSTDLASRGIDIKEIEFVVNFDSPSDSHNYLHRAGRTGRMGKSGTCISLFNNEEMRLIKRYQKDLKIKMLPSEIYKGQIRTSESSQ